MINKDTKFLIVGLGLLGGSYALGLKQKEYHVSAIDTNSHTIQYALEHNIIDTGSTTVDEALIQEADVIILGLYPSLMTAWIQENTHKIKKNTFITDVCGVKSGIVLEIQSLLPNGVEFIAAHPMAGKEVSGVEYADPNIFLPANFIITPTKNNTEDGIALLYDLANILRFKRITQLSIEKHDEMIAFLSQLPHVIAVCLMNCKESNHLIAYTGDSFRDLTRIAKINENLWSDLFLWNKDVLLSQIDLFMNQMSDFRELLANSDEDAMKEAFKLSTQRRKEFDN